MRRVRARLWLILAELRVWSRSVVHLWTPAAVVTALSTSIVRSLDAPVDRRLSRGRSQGSLGDGHDLAGRVGLSSDLEDVLIELAVAD